MCPYVRPYLQQHALANYSRALEPLRFIVVIQRHHLACSQMEACTSR